MTMQDSFRILGPDGTHECLVLESLGPSVADVLDAHPGIERLPGALAKTIAKQTLPWFVLPLRAEDCACRYMNYDVSNSYDLC